MCNWLNKTYEELCIQFSNLLTEEHFFIKIFKKKFKNWTCQIFFIIKTQKA